jgi:MFS family permease
MAAVRLLPFISLTIASILLNGALLPRFGCYMPWYLLAGIFMTAGGACLYTINSSTSPGRIYGYSILLAIGCGIVSQCGYGIASAKVKPDEVAVAIGFINIAQIGSGVISLTIAGTIFQNLASHHLRSALAGYGFSESEIRGAIAGTQSAVFQHGSAEVRQLAIEAVIKAMDSVFILTITAGAVCTVASVFMKSEKVFTIPVAES